MCKFESSQKDESKVQPADSSKANSKSRAFNCLAFTSPNANHAITPNSACKRWLNTINNLIFSAKEILLRPLPAKGLTYF